MKNLERWKYEMTQKEKDTLTFTPCINKNTYKILEGLSDNPERLNKTKEMKLQ